MIRADVNAGDFLKDVLNKEDFLDLRLIHHKCWRLTTNTGELEFMARDAMLIFFTLIYLTIKKDSILYSLLVQI